ncbi:MAG TPA: hypothetical protein VN982_17250 [Candidatus Dormibacteraeota bacterium]|nr:hypothetical protein [Candidatus Dormibacteraeota bacterium]
MNDTNTTEILKYTKAMLAMHIQALNKTDEFKPEIVLARAGLSARDIAELLGKSQAAVAKALQRAGKKAE